MSDATTETWDEEAAYDERIAPLMSQIIAICKERRIPMFASFAYAASPEEGVAHCTTNLPFDGRRVDSYVTAYRAVYAARPVTLAMTIVGARKEDGHG